LIGICRELEIDKLHLKGGKGKTKWTTVANQLKEIGFTYTPLQIKNKWQYEKCQFKKVLDHNRKTGRNRLEYKHDEVMREALKDDDTLAPKYLKTSEGKISTTLELPIGVDTDAAQRSSTQEISSPPLTNFSLPMAPSPSQISKIVFYIIDLTIYSSHAIFIGKFKKVTNEDVLKALKEGKEKQDENMTRMERMHEEHMTVLNRLAVALERLADKF
jgi:hypothetical protein